MLFPVDWFGLSSLRAGAKQSSGATFPEGAETWIASAPPRNDKGGDISFTVPAAYVTVVDLKDGPNRQRLGFELWSRSFDPAMPDRLEARRICGDDDCADGPFAKRRASDEDAISVEMTSLLGTAAKRHYVLAG